MEETLGNAWNHKNPRKISRTVNDRYIPISTSNHNIMSKYSAIGKSDTTTAPPCGLIMIPNTEDIQQSATPNIRDSDKLDTSIDRNFTNNLVAPTIFTVVISNRLPSSSSWDLYARVGMQPVEDLVNYITLQFVDFGFSTVGALDKIRSLESHHQS